jgi:RND family efflux transporter MFP subunit
MKENQPKSPVDVSLRHQRIVSLLLMGGFVAICYFLMASEPQSQRKKATYITPTVTVKHLKKGAFNVVINAHGLIKPAYQQITLSSQVSGKIIDIHPKFKPGGRISAGQTLVQIDTTDYQLALQKAAATLANAQAAVTLEKGQQQLAKQTFAMANSGDEARKNLALRKPQFKQVNALLTIAQIDFDQAKLGLKRTALTLPFDVLVLETTSTTGEYVATASTMATLTRADKVWLELKVQQKYLSRIQSKTANQAGSAVSFQFNNHHYHGQVSSIRADLTASTAMAGVIVEVVNKPFAPPLVIGSFIEATLQAGVIDNALKIPRKALVANNQIYIVDNQSKLQLRKAIIRWQLPHNLIIDANLQPTERLIVSRIAGIAPGSLIKGEKNENIKL